jgi:hypothetical protein
MHGRAFGIARALDVCMNTAQTKLVVVGSHRDGLTEVSPFTVVPSSNRLPASVRSAVIGQVKRTINARDFAAVQADKAAYLSALGY